MSMIEILGDEPGRPEEAVNVELVIEALATLVALEAVLITMIVPTVLAVLAAAASGGRDS